MSRRTTSTFRVRYGETDQMGVAYHANYLVWCEVGRTDFIRRLGVTYADLERQGHFLAVAEATVRYGAAARYDDEIRVETWLEEVRSRTVTFGYEILREAPEPGRLARATTRLVSIDHDGRPRALPSHLLDLFRQGASP
jgi:acyl-CoA thioester hydrolase